MIFIKRETFFRNSIEISFHAKELKRYIEELYSPNEIYLNVLWFIGIDCSLTIIRIKSLFMCIQLN